MTTTNSRAAGADAPGTVTVQSSDSAETGRQPTKARRALRAAVPHRNEIVVVGELTAPVEPRRRTDGGEVLTFRVAVRGATAGPSRDLTPTRPIEVGLAGRRDVLDCVVSAIVVRRRLETYRAGDVIELSGSLRHRFWNTAGQVQSRYEIEVVTLKRLARAPRAPDP